MAVSWQSQQTSFASMSRFMQPCLQLLCHQTCYSPSLGSLSSQRHFYALSPLFRYMDQQHGEGDWCLDAALPVNGILEMPNKPALQEQPLLPVVDVFSVGWVRNAWCKACQQLCCCQR